LLRYEDDSFTDITSFSLRGAYCLYHQVIALMMSVYFNQTTPRYILESCKLNTRHRENLKTHIP
jgi:hypothetical protein